MGLREIAQGKYGFKELRGWEFGAEARGPWKIRNFIKRKDSEPLVPRL